MDCGERTMDKNKFKVGDVMWEQTRLKNPCYRQCVITKIVNDYYPQISAKTIDNKNISLNSWNVVCKANEVGFVPVGTIYLVDTGIGTYLGRRHSIPIPFSIYECSNKMNTIGKLFGYKIIPGSIQRFPDNPHKKVWTLGPSTKELLSFLSNNLDEICTTYHTMFSWQTEQNNKGEGNDITSIEMDED
jgi:hypothetical protein